MAAVCPLWGLGAQDKVQWKSARMAKCSETITACVVDEWPGGSVHVTPESFDIENRHGVTRDFGRWADGADLRTGRAGGRCANRRGVARQEQIDWLVAASALWVGAFGLFALRDPPLLLRARRSP